MISTTITPQLLRGIAELEPTRRGLRLHRLPAWVRKRYADGQLLAMETQPTGTRLRFATAASVIELHLHASRIAYLGAERPRGLVDVFVDGTLQCRDTLQGGDVVEVDLNTGETSFRSGPPHITKVTGLPEGHHQVEIWLPHNESIELLDLRTDEPIQRADAPQKVWLHHGSSISHGSNAAAPSGIWPAVAARGGDVDLHNLSFGGSAMADPFMARLIRDSQADFISLKLGINIVNADAMRLRAFVPAIKGFLDMIRDGHPETPVVLISPIFCGIHEQTPGPGTIDVSTLGTGQVRFLATGRAEGVAAGQLTLEVIRRELASLVNDAADPHLHYLDGPTLYGQADSIELPLPDALHPDAPAHQRIGERFARYAFGPDGPFTPHGR